MGAAVFKTVERQSLSLVGSIPIRLRRISGRVVAYRFGSGVGMWRSAARLAAVATLLATVSPLSTPAGATTHGDNGVLAFVRLRTNGCSDLRTIQVAGTSARTLQNCPQLIGEPAWNSNGKQLAVSYVRASGAQRLALMPATGGTPHVLSTNVKSAHSPSFSSTGQVLAFTGGEFGPDQSALYTVPVTGGTATRLTPGNAEPNDEPDYSPTADTIAWTRRTSTSYDIWTVSVDAQGHNPTALTNLTNGTGNSRYPSWSPDGSRLAFASDRSGTWQVYVMSATGTDVVQVTTGTKPHIQPAWSPDGTKIAFTTGCTTSGCTLPNDQIENGNLQVIDVTDIAHPGPPQTVIGTSAAEFDPQWGRACASAKCPAAASLPRTASLKSFGHSLKARGGLTSAKSVCVSQAPVVLQYENVIDRLTSSHKHWLTEGKTTTSRTGAYQLPLPRLLTGWYRVKVPARRLGEIECAAAVTRIRQNLTVRDKRGDSRGPVDLLVSWVTVHHGVITHTIRTAKPFSTGNLVGRPCLPFFAFAKDHRQHYGGSIGCTGSVQYLDQHKPVTIRRPDSRTITYTFRWSELPKKFRSYEWVPWSRGTSDADWWDVIPNDSDVGTDRPPGNPHDMPYLFRKKPTFQQ